MSDPTPQQSTIAVGGRQIPFHVGEFAREIGGLGECLVLSGRIGSLAQKGDFADRLYAALCNTQWRNRHGERWACTWRCAGDIAAAVRGWESDGYRTFYCGGDEGRVDPEVRAEFKRLGWERDETEANHGFTAGCRWVSV